MDEKFHIMSSEAYQCQFCEENINGNHKDDHYALCDKFGSFVTDHVCKFCDKIFDDNIVLRNHIRRIHTKSNVSNNENVTLNSFEETKVEILALLKTFKSKDDSIRFLDWIRDEALDEMKNGCPIINNWNLTVGSGGHLGLIGQWFVEQCNVDHALFQDCFARIH